MLHESLNKRKKANFRISNETQPNKTTPKMSHG